MANFSALFTPRTEDLDLELKVEGTLPGSVRGTFYAIGGMGNQVGSTVLNALDAHGRVVAVRIGDGKASLRARMVDTPLWQAERSAPHIVKRRLFANKPSRWSNFFDVDLGNPVSHNVIRWGSSLVAANDPGFFVLDPETLATKGPAPIAPKKGATFGPMPRRDPATGRHVVFEVRPGRRDTLIVREIDDAFTVASERSYALPRGASFFHDIAFTEHYYLVMQFASVSLPAFLWGARPVADAVRFDPAVTPVLYLLPRSGGEPISILLPGGRTHFHFWNAFEADGKVVVDAIGYAGEVRFETLMPPAGRAPGAKAASTPSIGNFRYTVDPTTRTLDETKLTDAPAEAPEIRADRRGRPYRYGWAPTRGQAGDEEDRNAFIWFHALARHDFETRSTEVWDAGPTAYVSQVSFVSREGSSAEDDGHVLAFIQDAAASTASVGVFDAKDVARGPIARLTGAGFLGPISHVSFAASP
jgi:carotenoid cleavage dioxygenase-like enzyme